jgi:hypothetical protein
MPMLSKLSVLSMLSMPLWQMHPLLVPAHIAVHCHPHQFHREVGQLLQRTRVCAQMVCAQRLIVQCRLLPLCSMTAGEPTGRKKIEITQYTNTIFQNADATVPDREVIECRCGMHIGAIVHPGIDVSSAAGAYVHSDGRPTPVIPSLRRSVLC